MNPNHRYSAQRRANASTRERPPNDRAGRERPVPVNVSPEHGEDDLDSEERTNDHSPETTARDGGHIPPRARPRNEVGAVTNPDHPERRPIAHDTALGKRRLCEEVSLAIKGTGKRRKAK
jgi:hypothetical protein